MISASLRSIAAALLALPFAAWADGGHLVIADGAVSVAHDQETVRVQRGYVLRQGDTVSTAVDSKAQWMMDDDSMLALAPGSALRIDEFQAGKVPHYSLQHGSYRYVGGTTKAVVKTPFGDIQDKGTDYLVSICGGACTAGKKGLYVQVDSGSVVISNPLGAVECKAGQTVYVERGKAPVIAAGGAAAAAFAGASSELKFEYGPSGFNSETVVNPLPVVTEPKGSPS